MDFDFTEEQNLLRDSVQKFVAENYELSDRRKMVKLNPGYSEDSWKQFAELGWLGLPFAEEDGGFGGDLIDTSVIMTELGKGLVCEPYYASVILAGSALRHGGSAEQKDRLIGGIVSGEVKATLGYAELQGRYDLNDVATTAEKDGDAYLLSGTKSMVQNAETADYIIVSARTSGNRTDDKGITLFIIDSKADGIKKLDFPTVDGLRASEIELDKVKVSADDILGELDNGLELLEKVRDDAILSLASEAVGQMEILYQDTVDYCKQREQFGHPLAEFQVLKHRFADMFIEAEQCRSLLYRALLAHQEDLPEKRRVTHALKYKIGAAGRFVGENAVQSHGGMGVTEELRIGHYFMRLAVIDATFGNKDYHLNKYTDLMDVPADDGEEDFMPFM